MFSDRKSIIEKLELSNKSNIYVAVTHLDNRGYGTRESLEKIGRFLRNIKMMDYLKYLAKHNFNRLDLDKDIKNLTASLSSDDNRFVAELENRFQGSYFPDPDILIGDFNAIFDLDFNYHEIKSFDLSMYKEPIVIKEKNMKQFHWKESFEACDIPSPEFSCWSGRRVDYIFFNPENLNFEGSSFTIPVNMSDHIPIVADFLFPN